MPTKNAVSSSKRPVAHPQRDAADSLCRAARESCHQHVRLNRLLMLGADDVEFQGATQAATLADRMLTDQTTRYELAATDGRGREPEDWWHAANALWMAGREYSRRCAASDAAGARFKRHGAEQLGELTLDYELEMSARMALKHACAAYDAVRPDAV